MSDFARKDFTQKASEKVTPNSQKSYMEQGKEAVTDGADKLQNQMQPNSSKSTTQKIGDSVQNGHDNCKANAQSANQKSVGETASEYAELAKQKIGEAAEYVSATLNGTKDGVQEGAAAH